MRSCTSLGFHGREKNGKKSIFKVLKFVQNFKAFQHLLTVRNTLLALGS